MNKILEKVTGKSLLITAVMALSLSNAGAQTVPNAAGANKPLKFTFNKMGLSALQAGHDQLLSSGAFEATNVVFKRYDGAVVDGSGGIQRDTLSVDPAKRTVTRTYGWGVISCIYTPEKGHLDFDISITNKSEYILSNVMLQVLELKFPQAIKGFDGKSRAGSNVDRPTVVGVDYGTGTLAVANEDVGRPLYMGLPTGGDKDANARFPFIAANYRDNIFPSVWMDTPQINRPIYPGDTDHWRLSLRVGPEGPPARDLALDVYQKYAAAYPVKFNWPDRRPIGYLNLSSTVPHPASGTNPRGWFANDKTIDVTTDAGRKILHDRLIADVDNGIKLAKSANAQGLIIWDTEGQEYPHAMSYIGDPRHLPAEMEPIADEIFAKIKDAGLRSGVCLRPQKPMKTVYGDVAEQVEVRDQAFNLEEKVDYAKKRWGCTLFYVDSNAYRNPSMSASDEKAYELAPADVFQKIAMANPDVLFIPEQQTTRYYAYGAPYDELKQDVAATPVNVLRAYPGAFTVIAVATDHKGGDLDKRRDELVAAVKRGDILLFRSWYETPELQPVRDIYKAAGK